VARIEDRRAHGTKIRIGIHQHGKTPRALDAPAIAPRLQQSGGRGRKLKALFLIKHVDGKNRFSYSTRPVRLSFWNGRVLNGNGAVGARKPSHLR
jgi:hypothetical protein